MSATTDSQTAVLKRVDSGGVGWVTPNRSVRADTAALLRQTIEAVADHVRNPDVQVVVLAQFDPAQLVPAARTPAWMQSEDALTALCRKVTQMLGASSKSFMIRQQSDQHSPVPSQLYVEALSRRERQVLSLVTDGLAAREIGAHLSISERTVESHVRNGYRKLGINSRIDLMKRAAEFGL